MLRQGIWMAIFLAVFSVLTACAHNEIIGHGGSLEPQSGITGRWEALEPKNGLVNVMEILPDGKMKSSTIARTFASYHIEGDKVILIPDNAHAAQTETNQDEQSKSDDPGTEPVVYTFILEKDKLTLTYGKTGEVLDLQREGQATVSNSIVGNWSYKHPMGTTGRMIFDANGINVIRVPLPGGGMDLDYQLKGDDITITDVDKKHTQTLTYKLKDEKLTLTDGDKTTIDFIRTSEPK